MEGLPEQKKVSVDCQNESTDDAETTFLDSPFQMLVAATGNVWLPIVNSVKLSTTRHLASSHIVVQCIDVIHVKVKK